MIKPLNDFELQKLRRAKPALSKELISELDRAIQAFAGSQRFSFFENMPVSNFFTDRKAGGSALDDKRFGDLVALGTIAICSLPAVGPARVHQLKEVMERLIAGEAEPITETPQNGASHVSEAPPVTRKQVTVGVDRFRQVRRYSSIEAEKLLNDAVRRIKESPRFEEFKSKTLSEFWEPGSMRDPFIDILTVREFSELSVDNLLKKRSFGDAKIHGVLTALERCLAQHGAAPSAPEPKREPARVVCKAGGFESLRTRILEGISPKGFLMLSLAAELGGVAGERAAEFTNTMNMPADALFSEFERVRREVQDLARQEIPQILESWNTQLSAPGVPESILIEPHVSESGSREWQLGIARLALVACGAEAPSYDGERFLGLWTMRPEALTHAMKILEKMFSTGEDLEGQVATILPYFPLRQVIGLLRSAS